MEANDHRRSISRNLEEVIFWLIEGTVPAFAWKEKIHTETSIKMENNSVLSEYKSKALSLLTDSLRHSCCIFKRYPVQNQ
jgi:hypothetical protein